MGEAKTVRSRLTTGFARPLSLLRPHLSLALDSLFTIVFAPSCAACGELLDAPTRGPVCPRCWSSILPLTPPLCDACGDPLPAWRVISVPLARCPRCRRSARHIDRARAVGEYDGALRSIVHALKYDGRRSVARPLALLMRERAADLLVEAELVVAVPLHRSRLAARGFNQAADLARHLGLPVVRALRRSRATATQTGLPAAQRHRNVRDAFIATRHASAVLGRSVLLVDDVSTTGATLEACARTLKQAGARRVLAVTAARVVARPR